MAEVPALNGCHGDDDGPRNLHWGRAPAAR